MLEKFFNSFEQDKQTDPLFGEVEVHYNETDKTFYLMKDIVPQDKSMQLSLTVESASREAGSTQYALFEQVWSNFPSVLAAAYNFIRINQDDTTTPADSLQPESLYIGNQELNPGHWELSMLNTDDGTSYSIVEFKGIQPLAVSTEE